MAPRLEMFPFRYRNRATGKWIRAHYRAERHEIAARFAEFEISGEPELRDVDPDARYCNPDLMSATPGHRPVKDPPEREPPVKEPPDEDPVTLDGLQRFLLLVFLRRYVTYCARRRKYAAMNGAARLFANL